MSIPTKQDYQSPKLKEITIKLRSAVLAGSNYELGGDEIIDDEHSYDW